MQVGLEGSILDVLDDELAAPDEVIWTKAGKNTQDKVREMWGTTPDALRAQQAAMGGSP